MSSLVGLVVVLAVLAVGTGPVSGFENRVTVESRTFYLGQEACTVGVFFENSSFIVGIVAPLELREIDPGCYPASDFWRRINPVSRIGQPPFICLPPCPGEYLPLRTFAVPDTNNPCGSAAYSWSAAAANIDFVSPDAFMMAVISTGDVEGDDYYMHPGSDGTIRDSAGLRIGFTAPTVAGQFEIDTCCVRPANHLVYVDVNNFSTRVPEFTKGIVTITCQCPCESDPNCDGVSTDVEDVVETINVAFRAKPQTTDPGCARPRTDFDCNGVTDVVDCVRMSLVTFYGYDRATYFCAPCE